MQVLANHLLLFLLLPLNSVHSDTRRLFSGDKSTSHVNLRGKIEIERRNAEKKKEREEKKRFFPQN
jgi:hypothetical protein